MQTAVVCRVTVNKRECDWMGMLGGGGSRTRYNICVTKGTNGENLGNHYFEYMCKLHSCDIEYMCELHSCDIEYMCKEIKTKSYDLILKYICIPSQVVEAGNHFVWEFKHGR